MLNKLKGARVTKGLTQESISTALNMAIKTYNRKELGLVEFTRAEIIKVSNVLELTKEEVIDIFFDNRLTEWINNKTA